MCYACFVLKPSLKHIPRSSVAERCVPRIVFSPRTSSLQLRLESEGACSKHECNVAQASLAWSKILQEAEFYVANQSLWLACFNLRLAKPAVVPLGKRPTENTSTMLFGFAFHTHTLGIIILLKLEVLMALHPNAPQ